MNSTEIHWKAECTFFLSVSMDRQSWSPWAWGWRRKRVTSRQAVPGQYFAVRRSAANWTGQWNSNYSPEVTLLRLSRSSFSFAQKSMMGCIFTPLWCLCLSPSAHLSLNLFFPPFLLLSANTGAVCFLTVQCCMWFCLAHHLLFFKNPQQEGKNTFIYQINVLVHLSTY